MDTIIRAASYPKDKHMQLFLNTKNRIKKINKLIYLENITLRNHRTCNNNFYKVD